MSKIEVKVYLTPEEREHLDAQAKALNLNRSQLMRLRALGDPAPGAHPPLRSLSLRQYQNAVTAALRASNGSCSRPIVEAITAAVLCSVYEPPNKQPSPSPSQTVG
jgi:hypothetical protein